MDKFLEMQTFAAVVDAGSFVKAADALAMSKAVVSRYVGDLESRLGVRLLHRTTRRLSLTEEGQAFHTRCKELLWHFDGPHGKVSVRIQSCIHTNNGDTCRAAALVHQGVILAPTFLVGEDLMAGKLVELMPGFKAVELGIYAVYPTRKYVSPKVRVLTAFLAECFSRPRVSW
jgi:DNA-binding transcriptional LysR family regulator